MAHQQIGGEMKRWIAIASTMLGVIAVMAAAAVPASARVPGGKGLVSFGTVTCEGDVGEAELFGPRGPKAPTGFTDTGLHLIATRLTVTFDPFEGDPETFSKSYGKKTAMTTFTCTQDFVEEEGTGHLEITVAVLPPR
jgi:hypothetical protein